MPPLKKQHKECKNTLCKNWFKLINELISSFGIVFFPKYLFLKGTKELLMEVLRNQNCEKESNRNHSIIYSYQL